jgi:hypothetical protein
MVLTQKTQILPLNLHWTEMQFFYFRCDNSSPDGTDIQAGLIDQMVYQRHVGRFLVSPVMWCSVQSAILQMVCPVLGLYTLSCVGAGVQRQGTSSIDWAQVSMFYVKTETESSLSNVF